MKQILSFLWVKIKLSSRFSSFCLWLIVCVTNHLLFVEVVLCVRNFSEGELLHSIKKPVCG